MVDPQLAPVIGMVFSYTAVAVGIIFAGAALGSALGWGLICSKYIEGIARQPEMLPILRVQMFVTAGLMESFPFIAAAFAMYFTFVNPFEAAAVAAITHVAH
ncbi:F0F1 ATP synthase subunit C [Acidiferrobacter sp.]|jgi:F-type H+-transporting ATPase subunit c|uniref:F0F1 ATP synthase subunit C n=1 Tax=Acidiferrobacter sp. TaxID=1872107 RepID=UPI002606A331|nr:F0F1 ATP synthase subunit C [Acidiferrobacter sp.]